MPKFWFSTVQALGFLPDGAAWPGPPGWRGEGGGFGWEDYTAVTEHMSKPRQLPYLVIGQCSVCTVGTDVNYFNSENSSLQF